MSESHRQPTEEELGKWGLLKNVRGGVIRRQDVFNMNKPRDNRVIEEMFLALEQKRGWHNLPDEKRQEMIAYPPSKKWTLVYQDRLTEWEAAQDKQEKKARGKHYQEFDREKEEIISAPGRVLAPAMQQGQHGDPGKLILMLKCWFPV
jgi:hypothetical protein